jgi:hypothetical protein
MREPVLQPSNETQRCVRGLMLSFLVLFSSGCATSPQSVPPPKTIREKPPATLLVVTPVPRFAGFRNGDMIDLIDDYHNALGQCNANILRLQGWSDQVGLPPPAGSQRASSPR